MTLSEHRHNKLMLSSDTEEEPFDERHLAEMGVQYSQKFNEIDLRHVQVAKKNGNTRQGSAQNTLSYG